VDIVPYPVDWTDIGRFKEMASAFFAVANLLKERGEITHDFEWGGNWRTLKDYPHFEIK
jgi:peptidoglycan L-alanyl-D-glutamate endopeptidase CwlK